MSTATAADAVVPKKGKKKLVILIAVAAFVLAGVGGGAVYMMKKKAADAEAEAEADGDSHAPARAAKHDPKSVPIFVPLDPFTVNLADRDAERYAQVGITLELEDAQFGDQIKIYMPAIRNNVLLALADRTAAELQGRDGKRLLAEKLRREISRALGVEIDDDDEAAVDDEAAHPKTAAKKKPKKKRASPPLPVRAVHFSNFIVQ